ncbi:MAG: TraB/GumN family protein [Leptospiraceae bacterium]|nr:TraB/GumN family protein [Leptospiraceae bacterium]
MPLKEPIRNIKIKNCDVTILGTAHVSKASVEAVRKLSEELNPDTYCVELCDNRLKSMDDPDIWRKQDIFKVFKERRMYLLLSSLILSSFQKKLGNDEINPGDEMREAIRLAKENQAKLVPIDRDVQLTLKRSWGSVSFFSKLFLISALISSLIVKEEVTPEKIEEMKSDDALKDIFTNLPSRFDEVKNVIIDERDIYLAQKIRENSENSKKLLAVIGAGHLEGVMKAIESDHDLTPLEVIPKQTFSQKYSWLILPAVVLSLMAFTFYKSGQAAGTELVLNWILFKGALAALGAIIALAHPLSILLAFVTAPIGNFNPIIKPGWIAALCESWLRKPLVEDFENIAKDSEHFLGYWKNRVIRIFLVLLLPQIGSSLGTFLVTLKGIKGLL